MGIPLSVAIITFNEEKNIRRCLTSLGDLADEILVVDSFSTDSTKKICAEFGVRFVEHPFSGHKEQKNHAISLARYDHILSLDADEALDPTLQNEIEKVKQKWKAHAYTFNRLTRYGQQWIFHCGWYPNRRVRLFDRRKARWQGPHEGSSLHERIETDPDALVAHLPGHLLHYSFSSISEHVQKTDTYTTIAAQEAFKRGKRTHLYDFLRAPWQFFRDYIVRRGFLDGEMGLTICAVNALYVFLKYSKLRILANPPKVSECTDRNGRDP
ncbi:MAG: glycosyltransferase family 2 protein [Bacteriovoracales bacterium]|nr:glycosyltransferase family 2 protein [Bacteriovoracales bacterium]